MENVLDSPQVVSRPTLALRRNMCTINKVKDIAGIFPTLSKKTVSSAKLLMQTQVLPYDIATSKAMHYVGQLNTFQCNPSRIARSMGFVALC